MSNDRRAEQWLSREGLLVLSGYGLCLRVERSHLVVEDGIGAERRQMRLGRLDRELKRVVIVGHSGTITLDAIRWLHGVGVPLVHLDANGTVFLVAAPSATHVPVLRRAQALAAETGLGVRLSVDLVTQKIDAQRRFLERLPNAEDACATIVELQQAAERATTVSGLRQVEALAARAYWRAWRQLSLRFAPTMTKRVPRHWRTFGTRVSPLAGATSPRKAVNPANAILNYCYAILEAEARIALLAVGLDPMLGLMHTDTSNRDSLALDLIEPMRPAVDAFVLKFLQRHTFGTGEVFELLDGQCRLLPPLIEELAETAPQCARLVLPAAQELAKKLVTDRRQSDSRIIPNPQPAKIRRVRRQRRVVMREYRPRVDPAADPRRSPAAGAKRRKAMRHVVAANRAWFSKVEGDNDEAMYRRVVLPGLHRQKLAVIGKVTGLTKSACSRIRSGKVIPHPRHWNALAALARL